MNKWTKKQIFGAVIGGLAIAAFILFISNTTADAITQFVDQINK
jgi:hypothetical protein